MYLHTSPEFTMKKLLAAGLPRIFQMARVFRNEERSKHHHPEFIMLEWYRANCDYTTLMDDTVELVRACADSCGVKKLKGDGIECDPFVEWEKISVAEAVQKYAGFDLMATLPEKPSLEPDPAPLAEQAKKIGIETSPDDRWDDIYFRIAYEKIEPHLGLDGRPTILYDYPVCMAALSRRKPSDERLAERFEVYASGIELANAFSELTDAKEQRERFEHDMDLKEKLYGERYPIDEDFIAAVAAMPPAAGIAVGIDRLVMLITGASRIEDVLWAPSHEKNHVVGLPLDGNERTLRSVFNRGRGEHGFLLRHIRRADLGGGAVSRRRCSGDGVRSRVQFQLVRAVCVQTV